MSSGEKVCSWQAVQSLIAMLEGGVCAGEAKMIFTFFDCFFVVLLGMSHRHSRPFLRFVTWLLGYVLLDSKIE